MTLINAHAKLNLIIDTESEVFYMRIRNKIMALGMSVISVITSVGLPFETLSYAKGTSEEIFCSSFEDTENLWSGSITYDTVEKRTGERSAKLLNNTTVKINQMFELNPDKIYRFSVYLKGDGAMLPYVFYYDENGQQITNMPWNGMGTGGIGGGKLNGNREDWTEEVVNITTGTIQQYNPKYFSIGIRVQHGATPTLVDDVTITEIEASEENVNFRNNFVINPTIDMPEFWAKNANMVITDEEYHTYPKSARLDATAGSAATISNQDYYSAYDNTKAYEYTCYIKSDTEGNAVRLGWIPAKGQGSSAKSEFIAIKDVEISTEWEKYTGICYLPDSEYTFMKPNISCSNNGSKSGYVYVDDITLRPFNYPDRIEMTGSETVNLMEMTDDTMEVFYEAVVKSGENDSDVEIEWSVTSDYPEDIKISDEGVMTVTGNVQPGAEAEVSASLPEYFPDNMRVTKTVKFIFTVSDDFKEEMLKVLKEEETEKAVSFLSDKANQKSLMQLGFDFEGFFDIKDENVIESVRGKINNEETLDEIILMLNEVVFLNTVNRSDELEKVFEEYDEKWELNFKNNIFYEDVLKEAVIKEDAFEKIEKCKDFKTVEELRDAIDEKFAAAYFSFITPGMIEDALGKIAEKAGLDGEEEYERYLEMSENSSKKTAINKAFGDNFESYEDIYDGFMNAYKKGTKSTSGSSSGGSSGGGSKKNSGGNKITIPNVPVIPEIPTVEEAVKEYEYADSDNALWAKTAISELTKAGIVTGYEDGKFGVLKSITREEFLKMLLLALDLTDENAECEYSDVLTTDWYYKYVATATKHGIALGLGEGRFGAGMPVTREQMATFILRAADVKEINLNGSDATVFKDDDKISDYAKEAVYKAKNAGIINGLPDGNFNPGAYATRAEAAKMIYEIYKLK